MIISIQYLRAIAAFFVLLSHVSEKNMDMFGGKMFTFWYHGGEFGVDIFFIVSGFIMSYTTQNIHQTPYAFFTFIKKRIIRIIPLYWFLTFVALAVYIVIPEKVNSSGGLETVPFQSFFLLPVQRDEAYLLNVGWTLRNEFIFYFIFSVGLLFSKNIGTFLVMIVLTLLMIIPSVLDLPSLNDYYYNFLNDLFFEFALGMLLFRLTQKIKNVPITLSIFLIVLGFILFYTLQSGMMELTNIRGVDSGFIALIICFGFVSLEPYFIKKPIELFMKLGVASYSTYLLHPFILSAFKMIYNKVPQFSSLGEIVITTILVVASLFFGYLCYIFIEKNLTKITKRFVG